MGAGDTPGAVAGCAGTEAVTGAPFAGVAGEAGVRGASGFADSALGAGAAFCPAGAEGGVALAAGALLTGPRFWVSILGVSMSMPLSCIVSLPCWIKGRALSGMGGWKDVRSGAPGVPGATGVMGVMEVRSGSLGGDWQISGVMLRRYTSAASRQPLRSKTWGSFSSHQSPWRWMRWPALRWNPLTLRSHSSVVEKSPRRTEKVRRTSSQPRTQPRRVSWARSSCPLQRFMQAS